MRPLIEKPEKGGGIKTHQFDLMIDETVGRQVSFKNKRGGMITGKLILIKRD